MILNLDDVRPEMLTLSNIAHALSRFTFGGEVGSQPSPTLAQVSVDVATKLREDGASADAQMTGLLYFASAAFMPSPTVELADCDSVQEMASWGAPIAARIQLAVLRKFGAKLEYDQTVVKTVVDEVEFACHCPRNHGVAGPAEERRPRRPVRLRYSAGLSIPNGATLSQDAAEWLFKATALVIAREIGSQVAMAVVDEAGVDVATYRWVLRPAPYQSLESDRRSAPRSGGEAMVSLADDIRSVFKKHGFDPTSEEFEAMLKVAEAQQAKGEDPVGGMN